MTVSAAGQRISTDLRISTDIAIIGAGFAGLGMAIAQDADGQLTLDPELQIRRQAHDEGPHRVSDLIGGLHWRASISACLVPSRTSGPC